MKDLFNIFSAHVLRLFGVITPFILPLGIFFLCFGFFFFIRYVHFFGYVY
jgi:hypothetical protein